MANFLKKIWSGLDFWDTAENRQQREQFAREDEEERRRREREAAARQQARPGDVVQPEQQFEFDKPLVKVGSQSDFVKPLPKYKNVLEQIGDKFEANSPQDMAKREAEGQPRTYEEQTGDGPIGGAKWARRNISPKGFANVGKSFIQGVLRTPEDLARTAADIGLTAGEKVFGLPDDPAKLARYQEFKEKTRRGSIPTNPVHKFLYGEEPSESYFKTTEDVTKLASDFTGKDLTKAAPVLGVALLAAEAFTGKKGSQLTRQLADEGTAEGVKRLVRSFGINLSDEATESVAKNTDPKQIEGIIKNQGEQITKAVNPPKPEDAPEIPGTLQKAADEPAVEVADGVKSTNLARQAEQLAEEANNINRPAYQRQPAREALKKVKADLSDSRANDLGVGEAPIDRPAFQHKQQIEDVVRQGDDELNNFISENPGATIQQIDEAREAIKQQVLRQVDELNRARYGADPTIPDVADTTPLIKAADQPAGVVAPEVPFADFSKAENGTLVKAQPTPTDAAEAAARGELPISTRTDVQGNPALIPDAQAARELADQGIVPQRGPSPVAATEEQMAQAAEQAVREQFNPNQYDTLADTAGTGEIGRSKGKFARGQEYEKTSMEAAQARGAEGASTLSYEQLVGDIQSKGVITGQHVDTARVMQNRFPTGSPEHKVLGRIVGRQGTQAGQALKLQDQVIRKTASGKQITDRFANKLYRHMGDDATLSEADFDQLAKLSDDFVAARNNKDAAYNRFLDDPSEANAAQVADAVRAADEADKAAKLGEFQLAEGKLGGQRQNSDIQRFLTELEKDAGVYKMSYVDSSMLSSTRVMLNNFLNTFFVGQEEKLFGKAGARLARALTGESIGGGSRAGGKLGRKIGNRNLVTDYKLRKQGSGNPLVKAVQNFTTTGNTLGERNIQGAVYSGMYDHYQQALKQAGFKGDELKRRTLINTLIDPDNVKEAYTAPVLSANALSSLTGPRGKKIETAAKDWLTRGMGGSKAAEVVANVIIRTTLGFPTVIGRSFVQGGKRLTAPLFGGVSTGQAVANVLRGGDKAVTAQHIKNAVKEAGTGVTMIGMGAGLAQADIISGSWPTDPDEQEAWKREGKTDNSIKIAGNWYSLPAALGGFALPFMMGANLAQMEEGENAGQTALITAIDSLPIDSFSNTLEIFDNVRKGREVGDKLAQFGAGAVRGITPLGSLVNQIAKAFDPTVNDTTKGDALAQFLAKVQDGIPGLNADLPDKVVEGNVIENPSLLARMTGAISKEQDAGVEQSQRLQSDIDENLNRLNEYGIFTDSIYNLLDDDTKYIFDQARQGNQIDESDRDKLLGAITKGVTESGETRFLEEGDYDSHLGVLKTKRDLLAADPTTRKSSLEEYDKQIKRAEIYKKSDYPYPIVEAYKEVDLEEWRDLGDPDSEDYDPEMHEFLAKIDEELTGAGVGRGKRDKSKYYAKGSRGGGGSKKGPKISTSIAKQSSDYSFSPLKAQSATFAPRKSPFPAIEPVASYSRKPKKISVTKGVRL